MDSQMSLTHLPKEIRLQIWTLAYFSQPPRLVALRTKPHDEVHDTDTFCPRYSPSLSPAVMNLCHEARAEAIYQAQKAGHIVRLPIGSIKDPDSDVTEPFYFRFETDVLYVPLHDPHPGHYGYHPDNGLLEQFARASGAATSTLRTLAIIGSRYPDYRRIRLRSGDHCPSLSRIIMIMSIETRDDPMSRMAFVHTARKAMALYKLRWVRETSEGTAQNGRVDLDFATMERGVMKLVTRSEWKEWSEIADRWARGVT